MGMAAAAPAGTPSAVPVAAELCHPAACAGSRLSAHNRRLDGNMYQGKVHAVRAAMGFARMKQYDCSAIVATIGLPGD